MAGIVGLIVGLCLGLVVGFVVCWIWKSAAQQRLQQELDGLKASAMKSVNRL